jgi:hypothetical protein
VKEITSDNLTDYITDYGIVKTIRFDDTPSALVQVRIRIRGLISQPFAIVRFHILQTPLMAATETQFSRIRKSTLLAGSDRKMTILESHSEEASTVSESINDDDSRTLQEQFDSGQSMLIGIRRQLMRRASQIDRGVLLLAAALAAALISIIILTVIDQTYVARKAAVQVKNLKHIQSCVYQQHDLALILFRIEMIRDQQQRHLWIGTH